MPENGWVPRLQSDHRPIGRTGAGLNWLSANFKARKLILFLSQAAFVFAFAARSLAQTSDNPQSPPSAPPQSTSHSVELSLPPIDLKSFPRNLFTDQKNFWTTPFHMTESQWAWTVPLGFVGAALLASDTAVEKHVPTSRTTVNHAATASTAGVGALVGIGGGMYLWGLATHSEQSHETGILAGEAGIDALIDTEAFKGIFGRERPFTGDNKGKFFQGGASFPSEHSSVAWAIASVIAHEYPGPLTELLAYGTATGVGAARIVGHQHFATDVIVGSALGWYLGWQVYRSHSHYSSAEIAKWGTFSKGDEETVHDPRNMGSPYVPLDSWIYPAMDRLAALGYISSGFADMRPWTRLDCARQLQEAGDVIANTDTPDSEPERLYDLLKSEFAEEFDLLGGETNAQVRLESLYTRGTEIGGKPLTDGYHFGQTIINDYGRPEQRGFNDVSGLSGWAAYGPFAVYADGEYQHSPSAPALPLAVRQEISTEDFSRQGLPSSLWPLPADTPTAAFNQTRLLDAYVALNFSNWQLSYGNQSLWWGPSQGGPLMYSDNAQPLRMFRINRVAPFTLPSILSVLGPMRVEAFFGQYSGYQFVFAPSASGGTLVGNYGQSLSNQPIVHGERISFKPTGNLEIGLSRTTDYGGPGYPVTLHTGLRSLFSTGNALAGNPSKPGSRRSGVDFSYRIHNGAIFYAEGLAEHDEITPILGPDVASWLAGIYIPRLPVVHQLDLRVEGGFTDPVNSGNDTGFGAFYWDGTWITGFQNNRHIMGSWIGRQGQGAQAWTTYWFGPRSKLQFGFRHQKVSRQLLSNGGTLTDANVRGEFWLGPDFAISPFVQYERWLFPVIQPNLATNVTAAIELRIEPRNWFLHSRSSTGQP